MSAVPPIATELETRGSPLLGAKSGLMHRSKQRLHSITSVARASSVGGRPGTCAIQNGQLTPRLYPSARQPLRMWHPCLNARLEPPPDAAKHQQKHEHAPGQGGDGVLCRLLHGEPAPLLYESVLLQRGGLHPSEQLFALELGAARGFPFLDGAIPFRPGDSGTSAIARDPLLQIWLCRLLRGHRRRCQFHLRNARCIRAFLQRHSSRCFHVIAPCAVEMIRHGAAEQVDEGLTAPCGEKIAASVSSP
jgi:hypothetical protein